MEELQHIESVYQKPEFDGGSFTIEYLSTSPKGFDVKTRESLPRYLPGTPLPEAQRIKIEREREPKRFRIGPGFAPKVGIRNVVRNGNELSFDIKPVTFPTYKAISASTETESS